jgi:hypothetical protein
MISDSGARVAGPVGFVGFGLVITGGLLGTTTGGIFGGGTACWGEISRHDRCSGYHRFHRFEERTDAVIFFRRFIEPPRTCRTRSTRRTCGTC